MQPGTSESGAAMEAFQGPASLAKGLLGLPKEVLMKIMQKVDADARNENGVGGSPANSILRYRGVSTGFRNAVDAQMAAFECDIPAFERCTPPQERLRMGSPLSRVTLSLRRLLRLWPGLTSLTLRSDWSPGVLQRIVNLVAAQCHSLRRLSLENLWREEEAEDYSSASDAENSAETVSLGVLASLSNLDTLSLLNFDADRATTSWMSSLPALSDLTIRSETDYQEIVRLPSLTRLEVVACNSSEDAFYPLRVSPLLTELSLVGLHLHPELPPSLRRLKLRELSSFNILPGPALPELLELEVSCFDLQALPQLLLSCRGLTSLQVSGVGGVTGDRPVVISHLKNLEVLRLDNLQHAFRDLIPSLSKLTGLKSLHFGGLKNNLPPFGALQSLQSLTLEGRYASSIGLLRDLTAIVSLKVTTHRVLENCHVLLLLTALTNLQLSALGVDELLDLRSLRRLKSLRLDNLWTWESHRVRFREIPVGGRWCVWVKPPCLTSLELHGLPYLRGDPSLEHLTALVSLTLGGKQEVPSLAPLTALERLSFTKCPKLRVLDGLQGCTRLISLTVCGCARLLSVHLPTLPSLRRVDIKACPALEVIEGTETRSRFATVTLDKVKLKRSS